MSSPSNSTFDPTTQPVTIYMGDGVTPISFDLADVDAQNYYNTVSTINSSCQMGACFVMFFVLVVLTKESKRRTAIFILNSLSLVVGFLRALLLTLYFVSPWTRVYAEFSYDFSYVPRSAYATSVAGTVFPLLLTVTVNMSLVLQAYTVCKNLRNTYRYPIIGLACLVLLAAVGFRFAEMVTNCLAIMSSASYVSQAWIQTGALATETSSIWFFSIIFTGKLIWTLVNRRVMGWKQWSGVRILAAMGGCTMIIPCKCDRAYLLNMTQLTIVAIFASLEYTSSTVFPQAGTLALPLVALLLPMSSLWAGMAIDQEASTLNLSNLSGYDSTRRGSEVGNSFHGSDPHQFGRLVSNTSSAPGSSTTRKGSNAQLSPTTIDSRVEYIRSLERDSTELDLEAMGVRVERSYEVRSDK